MEKKTVDYINQIFSYSELYEFLAADDKTMQDVKSYLKEKKLSDSTKKRYISMLTTDSNGRFLTKNSCVVINKEMVLEAISIILKDLQIASDDMSKVALEDKDAQIKSIKLELQNVNEELARVKEELAIAQNTINQERENSKYWELRNKSFTQEQIEQQLDRKVVFVRNMAIKPEPDIEEAMLLDDSFVGLNIRKSISKYGGERESYFSEKSAEDSHSLTQENHFRRIAEKIMPVKFFERWAREIAEERKFNQKHGIVVKESESFRKDRKSFYENKSEVERHADELIRRRTSVVQSIMNDDRLSDQMKLQLYARFGRYHGTELERLINFAADYGINAKWFIQVLEDPDTMDNYENIRDYLRIFAKPSEYRKKMDFARELLDGEWNIQLDYDGKPTRFVLVPVREINEIRERLKLEPSKFTSTDFDEDIEIADKDATTVISIKTDNKEADNVATVDETHSEEKKHRQLFKNLILYLRIHLKRMNRIKMQRNLAWMKMPLIMANMKKWSEDDE